MHVVRVVALVMFVRIVRIIRVIRVISTADTPVSTQHMLEKGSVEMLNNPKIPTTLRTKRPLSTNLESPNNSKNKPNNPRNPNNPNL